MKISEFKYIITDIGGGWSTSHNFYGIKIDGTVYETKKFKDDIDINTEINNENLVLLGKLNNITLGLRKSLSHSVMDASELTIYSVNDTLVQIHRAPNTDYNNPVIYGEIQRLKKAYKPRLCVNIQDSNFIIGEIKTTNDFTELTEMLSKDGQGMITTYHASSDINIVDRLSEALKRNKTWKQVR